MIISRRGAERAESCWFRDKVYLNYTHFPIMGTNAFFKWPRIDADETRIHCNTSFQLITL